MRPLEDEIINLGNIGQIYEHLAGKAKTEDGILVKIEGAVCTARIIDDRLVIEPARPLVEFDNLAEIIDALKINE